MRVFLTLLGIVLMTMSSANSTAGPPATNSNEELTTTSDSGAQAQQVTAGDITIAPGECVTRVEENVWVTPETECLQAAPADNSSTSAARERPAVQEWTATPKDFIRINPNEVALSGIWLEEHLNTTAFHTDYNKPNGNGSNEVALCGIWLSAVEVRVAPNTTPPANLWSRENCFKKNEEVVETHIISPNMEVRAKGSYACTIAVPTIIS